MADRSQVFPCLLFALCKNQTIIVVCVRTFRVRAHKRVTHIVPASFLRDGCHYRVFAFRARKAARMIRRTLARFSGRCVQCNLLRGRLHDRRLSSLRAPRVSMTLSIACLSVRSSARMLNSFNVSLSYLKRNGTDCLYNNIRLNSLLWSNERQTRWATPPARGIVSDMAISRQLWGIAAPEDLCVIRYSRESCRRLLLEDQRRPADSLPLEINSHLDAVGDLDEGNALIHPVVPTVEGHCPFDRA